MFNPEQDIFYSNKFFSPNINKIILGEDIFPLINKDRNEISIFIGKNPILIEDQIQADFPDDSKNSPEIKTVHDEILIVDTKINKNNKKNKKNEKCFPFREGKGLEKCLDKKGIIYNSIKSKNINGVKYYSTNNKFKTIKYNDKGRKKKTKFDLYNIRKKIKNKIHKALTKIVNNKLEKAGSEKKFKNFHKLLSKI